MQGGGDQKSFTLSQGGGGESQKFHPYLWGLGIERGFDRPPPPLHINNEHSLIRSIIYASRPDNNSIM